MVADSLSRVLDIIGVKVFKDYFLMIDEIDSFQMDASFRKSMEDCIDYYKQFDKKNRCMLSATNIPFSDPELASERITQISYDKQTSRNIQVINSKTQDLYGNVVDRIKEILACDPNSKLMIAFNSVTGVFSIAEHLVSNNICPKKDIKILCSINSKTKVSGYFTELENDKLPGKINFLTSAYFTGFDLNEPYHLISVSGNKSKIHALSDKRLKQIAGRCRVNNGLLSETIIHDIIDKSKNSKVYSIDEIIQAAEIQLKALKCLEENYKKVPLLNIIQMQVTKQLLKSLDEVNSRFIRYARLTDEPKLSYLNIDSYIERNDTRNELYHEYEKLSTVLKESGHNVFMKKRYSNVTVDKVDVDSADKKQKVEEIITFLRTSPHAHEIMERLETGKNSSIQNQILDKFYSLRNFIDEEQLLDLFETTASKRDIKEFDNIVAAAEFAVMAPGYIFKQRMEKYFNTGKPLTNEEILKRFEYVYTELNIPLKIESAVKAIRLLKLYYKLRKTRVKNDNPVTYKVIGYNPKDFKIIGTKPELEDTSFFSSSIF